VIEMQSITNKSQITNHESQITNEMRPIVCMITDRRRLAGDRSEALVARVHAAARAGAHLILVRERDLEARPLTRLVERCLDAVRGTRTRVLVNDRLDVALAAGAHGVHLRGDSLPAARARTLAPAPFLVGRSVHSRDEAIRVEQAGGVDYLLFGTVFSTPSKPGAVPAGASGLADVAAATRLPIIAVGGMTVSTLHALGRSGAAGFAAIGLFAAGEPRRLQSTLEQASLAFDTRSGVP